MTETIGTDDALRALDARLRAHAFAVDENHDPADYPADAPRSPEFAAGVRAVARLERSTIPRLRRMLVSPTHLDARLTAFFSTWAYERYWIADRLDHLGAAHGGTAPAGGAADRAALRRDRYERVWLLGAAIATNLIGAPMVAVHVLQCLVDEWVLDEVYAALAAEAPDDRAAAAIDEIRTVKAEHAEILRLAFALRLPPDGAGRRLVALALRRTGWPSDTALRPAQLRTLHRLVRHAGNRSGATAAAGDLPTDTTADAAGVDRVAARLGELGLGAYRVVVLPPTRNTVLRIRRVR